MAGHFKFAMHNTQQFSFKEDKCILISGKLSHIQLKVNMVTFPMDHKFYRMLHYVEENAFILSANRLCSFLYVFPKRFIGLSVALALMCFRRPYIKQIRIKSISLNIKAFFFKYL